jgi:hypothetical protein
MSKNSTQHVTSIHVSVTEEFKLRVKREAKESGVGVSAYIKHVLLEKWDKRAVVNNVQINSRVNERPYLGRRVHDEIDWDTHG